MSFWSASIHNCIIIKLIRYQVEHSVRFTRNQIAKFRFHPSSNVHTMSTLLALVHRVRGESPRVRHSRPRWLAVQTGTAFRRTWASRVARDSATHSGIPRNKTAEASRRRSVDGASVKSDRPWRTQATAPPLLGQPLRSPEKTVPPPAVLPRCRRKHSLPVSSTKKHRNTYSKYTLKMPRVSYTNFFYFDIS